MEEEDFSAVLEETLYSEGTLLGSCRIDGFTAFSSIGEIYSATDTETGKRCSLHVISPAVSQFSPEITARLLAKVGKACFFRHKNSVSLTRCMTLPECSCVVMEHLEGRSVEMLLREKGELASLAPSVAAECSALLAAADASDPFFMFAPRDVFITPDGRVKVLFTGAEQLFHQFSGTTLQQMPHIWQNLLFAAPELLCGRVKSNFSASVYSLGALLYCMLCGVPPCECGNLFRGVSQSLAGNIVIPEELKERALLECLLAKDPARRPQTGSALCKLTDKAGQRKKILLKSAVFLGTAVVLLLTGVFCFSGKSSSRKSVDGTARPVRSPHDAPGRKAPGKEPVPAEKEKKSVSPEEPPYLAILKLSSPPAKARGMDPQGRENHIRSRLVLLERDLASGLVPSGLMKIHKGRIEFRKKQLALFEKMRKETAAHLERKNKTASLEVNKKLRQEIRDYLAVCRTPADFRRFRSLLLKRQESFFPEEKLQSPDIDFNMVMEFEGLPPELKARNLPPRKTTLAILLLRGCLIPAEKALALLAQRGMFIETLPFDCLLNFMQRKDIPFAHTEYLLNSIDIRNFPRHASRTFFSPAWETAGERILARMLLLECDKDDHLLTTAAGMDKKDLLELLLLADAPLEEKDGNGWTPLFHAAANGNLTCAALLRSAGANPLSLDAAGKKAADYNVQGELAEALRRNDPALASSALARGADVNFVYFTNETPLQHACRAGKLDMAKLLIEKGADKEKADHWKRTPLELTFCVTGEGEPEIFELLVQSGADTEKKLAADRKHRSFMEFLCQSGSRRKNAPRFAEIMLKSGKFQTAPHQIMALCHPWALPLFRVLAAHWKTLEGPEYSTLLTKAVEGKMPADVIQLLLERKVSLPSHGELRRLIALTSDRQVKALLMNRLGGKAKNTPPVTTPAPYHRPPAPAVPSPAVRRTNLRTAVNRKETLALSSALQFKNSGRVVQILDQNSLSPNVEVEGATLLQHAAKTNNAVLAAELLKRGALPFARGRGESLSPVELALKSDSLQAFKELVNVRRFSSGALIKIFDEILKLKRPAPYMGALVQGKRNFMQALNICFLTRVLRAHASEDVIFPLLQLYRELDAPKHRAVIHQAVAGEYRYALLRYLLSRKASVRGEESVLLKGDTRREFRGTVLKIASKVSAPRVVRRLLREAGAR